MFIMCTYTIQLNRYHQSTCLDRKVSNCGVCGTDGELWHRDKVTINNSTPPFSPRWDSGDGLLVDSLPSYWYGEAGIWIPYRLTISRTH